jgi:hypothetical protein
MRSDKVMVAFVAEFSRGKSELINAIFFAGYKRRIMPASAGRTTMCPTELGYDAEVPPLPAPAAHRDAPAAPGPDGVAHGARKWTRGDLDVNDPGQLAKALEKVAEVRRVSKDEARAWVSGTTRCPKTTRCWMPRAGGGAQMAPRLINIAHPLLKQGLVILDTPGLNAIGAEPELTVNLIPQAHAVVFILAADTGVTKSDLSIWREHLITESQDTDSRLVVLNKIDTMWDALSTPAQVQAQIDRQRATSAEILGLPREQVIPVSAQKGLVAKVNATTPHCWRPASCRCWSGAGQGVMGQRQKILRSAVAGGIAACAWRRAGPQHPPARSGRADAGAQGPARQEHVGHQAHAQPHRAGAGEFDVSGAKIHAVRSVHLKLLARGVSTAGHKRAQGRDAR